jgi:hypothetical protein
LGIGQDHSRPEEPRWCPSLPWLPFGCRNLILLWLPGVMPVNCAPGCPHLDGLRVERVSCGDAGMVIEARSGVGGCGVPGLWGLVFPGAQRLCPPGGG